MNEVWEPGRDDLWPCLLVSVVSVVKLGTVLVVCLGRLAVDVFSQCAYEVVSVI